MRSLRNVCIKSLSSFLSFSLILTSLSLPSLAHALPVTTSPFVRQMDLPADTAVVTDFYKSESTPRVIFVQDLHLHYPTQQRILKLLNHLYTKQIVSGPIAMEGVEGDYDTTTLAILPSGKTKEKLVDYFMRKGELSGDEAFAVLRGERHRLYGVDDVRAYRLNRELYKATLSRRKNLYAALGHLQSELTILKNTYYTRELRELDREEPYNVASAQDLLQQRLQAVPPGGNADLLRNLVQIDHSMYFLNRLLRQETTLEEVHYIAQRLPQFVDLTEKLLKLDLSNSKNFSTDLEETLKSAIDFYSVALMRDEPLATHTLELVKQHGTVVLIAGGFHTAGVTQAFKKAGVGYVVVTPVVNELAEGYHDLYEKRISGQSLTVAEVQADFPTASSWSDPIFLRSATQSLRYVGPLFESRNPQSTAVIQAALRGIDRMPSWSPFSSVQTPESLKTRHALYKILGNKRYMLSALAIGLTALSAAYGLSWITPIQVASTVGPVSIASFFILGASVREQPYYSPDPNSSIRPEHLAQLKSPFVTAISADIKTTILPIHGAKPGLADDIPDLPFSLMEAETQASAAALFDWGLIGLAGRIQNQITRVQIAHMKSPADVAEVMLAILTEHGNDWGVVREAQDAILAKARTDKKFKTDDPLSTVTRAVKDVMDNHTKNVVVHVNERIAYNTVDGMDRYYGASEGLLRDDLEPDEAIASGESLKFRSQRQPSVLDSAYRKVEALIGLLRRWFTNVDVLEGTNVAAGVVEKSIAFKDGDPRPENVHLVNFSGATTVGGQIIPDPQDPDVTVVNASDGYAHVFVASLQGSQLALLKDNPPDADEWQTSLEELRAAAGGLPPQKVDVVMLNREREKDKILQLSEMGYNVYLIPDGTMVPAIFITVGGRFNPDHIAVELTSSAAPEATIVAMAQKALREDTAVGSYRLLPSTLPKNKPWIGRVYLSDPELADYERLQDVNLNNRERQVFEKSLIDQNKFPFSEIREYQDLHPNDWKEIITGRRLITPHDIPGDIDLAVTFVTDNPVFKVPGVRRTSTGEVEVHTLRIISRGGVAKAFIKRTVVPNASVLASGEVALAELRARWQTAVKKLQGSNGLRTPRGGRHPQDAGRLKFIVEGQTVNYASPDKTDRDAQQLVKAAIENYLEETNRKFKTTGVYFFTHQFGEARAYKKPSLFESGVYFDQQELEILGHIYASTIPTDRPSDRFRSYSRQELRKAVDWIVSFRVEHELAHSDHFTWNWHLGFPVAALIACLGAGLSGHPFAQPTAATLLLSSLAFPLMRLWLDIRDEKKVMQRDAGKLATLTQKKTDYYTVLNILNSNPELADLRSYVYALHDLDDNQLNVASFRRTIRSLMPILSSIRTMGNGDEFQNDPEHRSDEVVKRQILMEFQEMPSQRFTAAQVARLTNITKERAEKILAELEREKIIFHRYDGVYVRDERTKPAPNFIKTTSQKFLGKLQGGQKLPLKTEITPAIQNYLSMPIGEHDRELVRNMARDYDYRSRDFMAPSAKLWFLWGMTWAQMAQKKADNHGIVTREVVLARDTRQIEPELIEALAAGLAYAGLNVIYVGNETANAASTYATALAEHRPLMGIFITSSHVTSTDDIQIRGAKVSMQNGTGVLASLTTQEIKESAGELIETYLTGHLDGARGVGARGRQGRIASSNPNALNVRWNALVGRVAFAGSDTVNLRELKADNENDQMKLPEILAKWEGPVRRTQPLQGIAITIDGAHTPTGGLAAAAFSELGASVDLIHGDVKALTGMHQADPSKLENLEALKARMMATKSLIGITFDLDGDRVAIVIQKSDGTFLELPPDNLVEALTPFLASDGGFNTEKTGEKYIAICDVLSTEGVDEVGAKYGIGVRKTDAGYVFLKAEGRDLRAQGHKVMILGERSGHAWLMGEFENPLEVAITYAVMAVKYQQAHPESANPFLDVYQTNTVPYLQSARFQPPFHDAYLQMLGNEFGAAAGWTYTPGAVPNQRIIALGRDQAIRKVMEYFKPGREFETPAGKLTVKSVTTEAPSARQLDGLYRFADIQFVDVNGISAGHFVLRASANDPTFVTSYETRVRGDGMDQLRYQSVGGMVLNYLDSDKLAYVLGDQVKDKNTLGEAQSSLVPYREYLAKRDLTAVKPILKRLIELYRSLRKSIPALLAAITVTGGYLWATAAQAETRIAFIPSPSHALLPSWIGSISHAGLLLGGLALGMAVFGGRSLIARWQDVRAKRRAAEKLVEPIQKTTLPDMSRTDTTPTPPSATFFEVVSRYIPRWEQPAFVRQAGSMTQRIWQSA
jgi:phosphomannomutase